MYFFYMAINLLDNYHKDFKCCVFYIYIPFFLIIYSKFIKFF